MKPTNTILKIPHNHTETKLKCWRNSSSDDHEYLDKICPQAIHW